jgi:hypothetical protein
MCRSIFTIAILASITNGANAQPFFHPFTLLIETMPSPATPADSVNAHLEIGPNSEGAYLGGFLVGTTFDTQVDILGDSINISIETISPPPPGNGEGGIPSFFRPVFDIPLGCLARGEYQIAASLSYGGLAIARGGKNLNVVPEPSMMVIVGCALALVACCRRPQPDELDQSQGCRLVAI